MAQKRKIDDYKNRLGAPIGGVLINPKTGKPYKNTAKKKK